MQNTLVTAHHHKRCLLITLSFITLMILCPDEIHADLFSPLVTDRGIERAFIATEGTHYRTIETTSSIVASCGTSYGILEKDLSIHEDKSTEGCRDRLSPTEQWTLNCIDNKFMEKPTRLPYAFVHDIVDIRLGVMDPYQPTETPAIGDRSKGANANEDHAKATVGIGDEISSVRFKSPANTLLAKGETENDSRNMVGRLRMKNLQDAAPIKPRSDEAIAEDVERALDTDPVLGPFLITVSVRNGQVLLRGVVRSQLEKERAGSVASRVSGVVRVKNELLVKHRSRAPSSSWLRGRLMSQFQSGSSA